MEGQLVANRAGPGPVRAHNGRSSHYSHRVVVRKAIAANGDALAAPVTMSRTEFVAETLLPTTKGKFRLRGYRHTVSDLQVVKHDCSGYLECFRMRIACGLLSGRVNVPHVQADGGHSWTEPTVMIHGQPEGRSNVRLVHSCLRSWAVPLDSSTALLIWRG